jgi:hypothetical protein
LALGGECWQPPLTHLFCLFCSDLVAQLWCVPQSAVTEDDAWKCVKNDEQRHSHFLFNRTQASALRMKLAATAGLAGA